MHMLLMVMMGGGGGDGCDYVVGDAAAASEHRCRYRAMMDVLLKLSGVMIVVPKVGGMASCPVYASSTAPVPYAAAWYELAELFHQSYHPHRPPSITDHSNNTIE